MKLTAILGSFLLLAASPLYGQRTVELHPYAGGFFPTEIASPEGGSFKSDGMYGLRVSTSWMEHVSLEGNLGFINHFQFEGTAPRSRAIMWDVNTLFHFFPEQARFTVPFLTVGVGGATAIVGDVLEGDEAVFFHLLNGSAEVLTAPVDPAAPPPGRVVRLGDGDTFFTINYGGGIKALELWGPVGLRFDVRGRTLPNLLGSSHTWLETVGGLTFSWGEF